MGIEEFMLHRIKTERGLETLQEAKIVLDEMLSEFKRAVIKSFLLEDENLSMEEIASMVDVPIEFVEEVKGTLVAVAI